VNFADTGRREVRTGAQLQSWQTAIDTPAASLLIIYDRKRKLMYSSGFKDGFEGKILLVHDFKDPWKPELIGWGWGETDPAGNLNDLTDDHRRNAVTATPSSRTFYCRMEKVLLSPPA